jgi:transcriptional regulator with XRE-family HTH domain
VANEVEQARQLLGDRLREIRKDARVSGRQLGALTGWHFTKISKIEHGHTMPSAADIELWCFHCGADDQIPDLTAAARGIEKMYVELKRLLRSGTASYQRKPGRITSGSSIRRSSLARFRRRITRRRG